MKTERQCREMRDALLWEAHYASGAMAIEDAVSMAAMASQKIAAAEVLDWVLGTSTHEGEAAALLERVAKRRASA